MDVEFKDKFTSPRRNQVMIVGQNPGRQRMKEKTGIVWEGNQSADLIIEAIRGLEDDVYLTNVVNYQEMDSKRIREGIFHLKRKINRLKPRKIIALGAFSHVAVMSIGSEVPVRKMLHPSFVVRFKKDKQEYIKELREHINEHD